MKKLACVDFTDDVGFSEDNENTRAYNEARTEQHCNCRNFIKDKIAAQKA